ncbi:hypothetical protein N7492_000817 [Penicillium capsulatum]|uniref:WW domain-containing protein n=1 Tax=Penicillium capsulatum TaxID=69766 RepID=A0A9W9ITI9_9EURO|nr:hypothetical protein N7492_000817 [Penicillium capsulatum]KAJ6130124.1 hypothetical protein N7512_002904 [Penicillium capsulatum]
MSASYAPPPGPPPPSVPEGWKAQYDERYQTWFYVNIATGKSQWEAPEAPTSRPDGPPPSEPPPSYDHAGPADPAAVASAGDKKQNMASNNPYNPANAARSNASPSTVDDDARLAAKLQAEEDARAGGGSRGSGTPGAAGDYYSEPSGPQSMGPGYAGSSSHSPMPEQKRSKGGFLSKLMGKSSGSSSRPPQPQYASYPQQSPQGGYYGGYPPQPNAQPGYGYPPGGYGGYPQQGGYYPQQPPRRQGGGMGTAGAAALGVGGGLLGGMLLADAVEDHHDYDGGGYDGGGYDGGDGGDFGGDF